MAKYIDPMTDTGFKIVFGKEDQSNEGTNLSLHKI